MTNMYPASPATIDAAKLEPTPAFRKQVLKVVFSVVLFVAVYLLLIICSLLLVAACCWGGIMLVIFKPAFFTLMVGLGLVGLGIAVFVFLVKFIFSVSKNENDQRVEITKAEQPELFAFIKRLTEETKTPFPKKVFISGDVNASVFYNSSFWSMFLPIRKNLEIGLGFVNSVNISEFKAVMAHEFGHFSQRSMKLGSFTYNVNKVIYNMLYDNKGYTQFLNSWGNISGYFAFFAAATTKIAVGIQALLKEMYKVVNKNYLGLSREMEFNADAVAASVAGGNNLVSALSRIEMAASCYDTALNNAGEWLKEKKFTRNLFNYQLTVFQRLAKDNKLELKAGIPEVPYHFIASFSSSRVNFKNQWASHPTLQERKKSLEQLGCDIAPIEISAWSIFHEPQALQQQMTERLYASALQQQDLEEKEDLFFAEWYNTERDMDILPEVYNGYYNSRYVHTKDWDIETVASQPVHENMSQLFTTEHGQLQSTISNNQADIRTIKAIKNKEIDIKSFDFDGKKYSVSDCDMVVTQLEKETEALKLKQTEIDKKAMALFHQLRKEDDSLKLKYKNYQAFEILNEEYAAVANKLMEAIQPFYYSDCSITYVVNTIEEIKQDEEKQLKAFFSRFINDQYIDASKEKLVERLRTFNQNDFAYFASQKFHNEELNEFTNLVFEVAHELNNYRWKLYKSTLMMHVGRLPN